MSNRRKATRFSGAPGLTFVDVRTVIVVVPKAGNRLIDHPFAGGASVEPEPLQELLAELDALEAGAQK